MSNPGNVLNNANVGSILDAGSPLGIADVVNADATLPNGTATALVTVDDGTTKTITLPNANGYEPGEAIAFFSSVTGAGSEIQLAPFSLDQPLLGGATAITGDVYFAIVAVRRGPDPAQAGNVWAVTQPVIAP